MSRRSGASLQASPQAFVDAYAVDPEHVQVFIQEVDHENWAKAGKLAIDR
jgi:phenylpyruvate tautomerase PptA (4-oxalocrotonate tautomerase family)